MHGARGKGGRGGGVDGGIICLISTRRRGGVMCAWGLLTGSHKQVAASLPRGPAAAAMMGGGTAAVWRAERREALQQHPSAGGAGRWGWAVERRE